MDDPPDTLVLHHARSQFAKSHCLDLRDNHRPAVVDDDHLRISLRNSADRRGDGEDGRDPRFVADKTLARHDLRFDLDRRHRGARQRSGLDGRFFWIDARHLCRLHHHGIFVPAAATEEEEAMIHGVTRPDEVAHLGLSNRLLARIGALLKKKLAVSLAALEAAQPNSPLESILLRAEFLQAASTLDTAVLKTLAQNAGLALALSVANSDAELRVLCLDEELESDASWHSAAQPLSARSSSATPARISDTPSGETNVNALFGDEHLSRTRLKLMTSANAGERIEALRVLAYAPLGAADESVRAEAALLLPNLGVSADVSAALADLNRGETAKRLVAADKLDKIAGAGAAAFQPPGPSNELEDGALIVCAMSALKSDVDRALKLRLISLLQGRAQTVGRNAARLEEIVRVVLSLIAAAFKSGPSSRQLEELLAPAHKLVRELGRLYPHDLLPILKAERERAPDFSTLAYVLGALFDLIPPGHADEEMLLAAGADYLARDTDEGRDSRTIGALMSRRASAALEKLCAAFSGATMAGKKHMLILLDEMCRRSNVPASDFVRAAQVILEAMESGAKFLRMAAMECRLVFDARVPPDLRRKLAQVFLDSTGDFSFQFDLEKAESAVVRMGEPAVEPLLSRLGNSRASNERVRCARLLGELALEAKAEPGRFQELQTALTDALRRLEAASLETDFPDRGEVFSALGKVIASPAASADANAVVTRTLLEAAASADTTLAAHALEGASYLASSRRAAQELISEIAALLKKALDAPEPEKLDVSTKDAAGEAAIEIRGGEYYAVTLPSVLNGLTRVALAPNAPAGITREAGALLLERWKEVCAAKRVWGPANSYLLIQSLRAIALDKRCGDALRLDIVKGLLLRYLQTPAMRAISDILAGDDTPASGGVALGVGYALLARRDREGRFDENDRADVLASLAMLAGRKYLIAPPSERERTSDAFRRAVVHELIKALLDEVSGAVQALSDLSASAALPAELRTEIERRVKARGELVVRRK